MLSQLLIPLLESAISAILSYQITDHSQWQDLYGKPILIRIKQPEINLYCIINSDKLILRNAKDDDVVSVSITTSLSTLLDVIQKTNSKHTDHSRTNQSRATSGTFHPKVSARL